MRAGRGGGGAGPAPLSRLGALRAPVRVVLGPPAAAGWEILHGLRALPEAASSQPACGAGRALGSPSRPPPPAEVEVTAAPAAPLLRTSAPSSRAVSPPPGQTQGRGEGHPGRCKIPGGLWARGTGVTKESALAGSERTVSSASLKSHSRKGPRPGHTGSP